MLFILREILRENMVNVIFLGEYSIEMVYICRPFDWLVLEKLRLHWHPSYSRDGSPVSRLVIHRCVYSSQSRTYKTLIMSEVCFAVSNGPLLILSSSFHRGSGEAAVPERNPSSPPRPRMALPLRGEGEEGAEQRKVSGQRGVALASSSLLHDVI